ncbi:MAG: serine/threonine protein kinase [Selenomonadaceae bacterium]|nr:serine/threonine protein kinase [Selenomonadaceae bacterium]
MHENFYKPIDILKTGESGDVQLVYDKVGKQICVIKHRSLTTLELYKKLKAIKSRYIPKIFRLIEVDGKFFVVEEYIAGQTLSEILQYENFLHEDLAAQILRQLCECLQQLHAEKIIHRDIKPSNIMLTRDNFVRLIDFSISRIEKENVSTDTEFLGTRGYAPPEQYGFGQTDSRSDIYSLGVTIQRLLGKNYSGWLTKIISRCTKLDPENRYQSVDELLDDFDRQHWQQKLKLMKNFSTVDDTKTDLNVYEKFDKIFKQFEDLDAVIDGYVEAEEDSVQKRLLEKSVLKITEDVENTVYSVTEEDLKSLPPEELQEVLAELEKLRADLDAEK